MKIHSSRKSQNRICVSIATPNQTQGFSTVYSNKRNIPNFEKINVNPIYIYEFIMKLFLPFEENVSVYL